MHEAVAQLAALLGTWRGEGRGDYPTIEAYGYVDEWEFTENGRPFVRFVERTWIGGEPRHGEMGYLRCLTPGVIEIVAALPTGQAECGLGSVDAHDGLVIATDSTVQNTQSAKPVDRIVRRFEVTGDTLAYGMEMAAAGQELTLHLKATLRRV